MPLLRHPDGICLQSKTVDTKKKDGKEIKNIKRTDLLTVVLCELVEESASLLRLEISQHGGDDGADVLYGK